MRVTAPKGARLPARSKALKGEPQERHRPEKGREPVGGANRRGRGKRRGRNGTGGRILRARWTPAGRDRCRGAEPHEGGRRVHEARRRRPQGHTLQGRPSPREQPGPWPRTVSHVEDLAAGGTAGREPRTRARLDGRCGSSEGRGKTRRGGASPATAARSPRRFEALKGTTRLDPGALAPTPPFEDPCRGSSVHSPPAIPPPPVPRPT